MALLTFTHRFISLDVSDRIFGDTIIKQRARFKSLLITQDLSTGEVAVLVTLKVDQYSSEAGAYGILLDKAGLAPYEKTLIANNMSAVNAETGQVILIATENETQSDFTNRVGAAAESLMLQGDWFEWAISNLPKTVASLIIANMEAANKPPYNHFSS